VKDYQLFILLYPITVQGKVIFVSTVNPTTQHAKKKRKKRKEQKEKKNLLCNFVVSHEGD
jgi:hypothetical protein